MTNNKLTDERVPDERLEQFADIATRCGFFNATTGEVEAMVSELRQRRAADRNYFLYGIAEPDGCAYLDELCVSRDIGVLQSIADELNLNEGTDGYRVVALYTALPLTDDERRELQEYRKAPAPELKLSNLINKFYERYPLDGFESDGERSAALGYFMAGAELQCFGEFVKYEDLYGDE
jgi:hypothetical protein